jgi:DNA-binding MarR family transcriptional regulator
MEDQMLDDLAHEMYEIVHEIIKKYQFRDRNQICCYDITVSQCYVLYEVKSGPLTMRNLASRLFLDISTMSRVVDQLQKKNYIVREPDIADRRITYVSLTKAGKALLSSIESDLIATEKEILKKITPAARHSVLFVLRELAKSIDNWQSTCCTVSHAKG